MENTKNPNQEMQTGVGIVMCLLFSVTRTVHLFSRVPGSCGPWHFGLLYWIGFVIQLYYYQANVQASGQFDAIPDRVFVYGTIGWLIIHWLCGLRNHATGYRPHSYSCGVGILYRLLPKWEAGPIAMASDIVAAGLLAGVLYLCNCPILASWYLSMIVWCLIAEACLHARNRYMLQKMTDARVEADTWSERISEEQLWVEQQRDRWGDRYS